MKNFKSIFFAAVLTLAMTATAFAGTISTTKAGTISTTVATTGTISTTAPTPGTISTTLVDYLVTLVTGW